MMVNHFWSILNKQKREIGAFVLKLTCEKYSARNEKKIRRNINTCMLTYVE